MGQQMYKEVTYKNTCLINDVATELSTLINNYALLDFAKPSFYKRHITYIKKIQNQQHFQRLPLSMSTQHNTSLEGIVPLAKELSKNTKKVYMFDDLQKGSLVSLGKLCDVDCIVIFTKYGVRILKKRYNHHRWKEYKQRPMYSSS